MTRPAILDLDLVVVPIEAAQVMLDEVTAADQHEPFSDTTMSGIFDSMLSASPYPTAWDDVRKYVEGLEAQLVAVAGPCSLGVGCEQYGVCYAGAHGKPEECGKPSFECEALKDARRIADHDKKLWLAAEAKIEILIAENSRIQSELEEAAGLEKAAEEELSAAEARIAEMEAELSHLADLYGDEEKPRYTTRRLRMEVERAKAAAEIRIAELEKRLADAERVIEPFAAYAAKDGFGLDFHEKPLPDEDSPGWVYVTNGDFRAARAYMEGK